MTLQKMAGVFCRFWSLEMTTFVKTGNMPQQEKDQAALTNCASRAAPLRQVDPRLGCCPFSLKGSNRAIDMTLVIPKAREFRTAVFLHDKMSQTQCPLSQPS
jgi:hypothetical protein